jgi:phage shock protein A
MQACIIFKEEVRKMTDNQFDRFEGMLTQLVSMVGHLREDVDTIKQDVAELKVDVAMLKTEVATLKTEMTTMKTELNTMKETQEKQHAEVIGKLDLLSVDQEITWKKTVENEREIERLKKYVLNN